jgi:hypothetical protein
VDSANECLERTGDEGRAIREANAVIARQGEAGDECPLSGGNQSEHRLSLQQATSNVLV